MFKSNAKASEQFKVIIVFIVYLIVLFAVIMERVKI